MYLTYAKSPSGELIHISRATTVEAFVCPYCGEAVIAKRGPVVGHHYAHRRNSCRPDYYAPLPTEYEWFTWGLTAAQFNALAKHGNDWRWFNAGKINWATRAALTASGYIDTWTQPNPERWSGSRKDITGGCLAARGLAAMRLLPLPAWMEFVTRELQRLASAENIAPYLSAEVQRLAGSTLYFLEINGGELYKIGVTARPIGQRVAEIKQHLAGNPGITVLRCMHGAGAIEPYFKWLHRDKVQYETEYFAGLDITQTLNDLDAAAAVKPVAPPRLLYDRRDFTGIFSHAAADVLNEYTGHYEPHLYLVNIKDAVTGAPILDWHRWKIGNAWDSLYYRRQPDGSLAVNRVLAGQLVKFRATLEKYRLLRPAKVSKL